MCEKTLNERSESKFLFLLYRGRWAHSTRVVIEFGSTHRMLMFRLLLTSTSPNYFDTLMCQCSVHKSHVHAYLYLHKQQTKVIQQYSHQYFVALRDSYKYMCYMYCCFCCGANENLNRYTALFWYQQKRLNILPLTRVTCKCYDI